MWGTMLTLTASSLKSSVTTSFPRSPAFLPHLRRVGIDYPLLIQTPVPVNRRSLYHDITLRPSQSFILQRLSSRRFVLRPRGFWPSSTVMHFSLATPKGIAKTLLNTDAGKVLKVNLSTQSLAAYTDGHLVRLMPISSGTAPRWTTPKGVFYIYRRVLDDHMQGGIPGTQDHWNVKHVPYAQYIYGAVAIHGAWWNHHFGIPRSHGCIQLSTKLHNPDPATVRDNAKWVWNFTDIGTPVIISGQTPQDSAAVLPYPEE